MLKLDLKNKKILTVLDEDPRAPLSKIASRVGLSKQVVDYRIKTLLKKGVIKGFNIHCNLSRLGYSTFGCYLRLRGLTEEKEKQIIDFLVQHPFTKWVVICEGKWDLAFALAAKNILDFNHKFEEITDMIGDHIEIYDTNIIYTLQNFSLDLLGTKKYAYYKERPVRQEFSTGEDIIKIDETDIKILQHLDTNSRASLVEITNKINTSADTIRYRLRNLVARKIITDFNTRINIEALGYNWYQLIIDLRRFQEADEKKFMTRIKQIPNIHYIVRCMGKWDFEIHLLARSIAELRRTLIKIRDLLSEFIISYDIMIMFKKYKSTSLPRGVAQELIKKARG